MIREILYFTCNDDVIIPVLCDEIIWVKNDVKKKEITVLYGKIEEKKVFKLEVIEDGDFIKAKLLKSKDFYLVKSLYEDIEYLVKLREITGWEQENSCYFVVFFGKYRLRLRNNYFINFKNTLKSIQKTN